MDTGILTTTLNDFLAIAQQNYDLLHVWAMRLFYVLVTLDIVLAVLFPMIKGENWTPNLIRRLIVILFLFTFITNYDYWVNMVVNGGIAAGIKASTGQDLGGDAAQDVLNVLKSPSTIMDIPGQVLGMMWDDLSIFDVGGAIMLVIIGLLMFLSFAIVALTVIVTYLEFTFAVTLSLILLPFAALKQTSFIGEKVFSLVVSYSVRLMVLAFIVGVGHTIFNTIGSNIIGNYQGWQQGLSFMLAGILYLMLAMSIPKMAAGLFSGSPSLGAGDAAMAAGGAMLAGAGVAMGAVGAAKGAAMMASKTSAAATTAGGFAKGAYSAGKAGAGGSLGPVGGFKGAVQGMKSVGQATGRAVKDSASRIKNKIAEPVRNRFESARLSGNLASKEAPANSRSAWSGSPKHQTAGESFSEKQNMSKGAAIGRSIGSSGRTAGRGVMQTAYSSQSPITPDSTQHIKDES